MTDAEKIVSLAYKDLGNTYKDYGLNDEWCARFISNLAERCGFIGKYFVNTNGAGCHPRYGVKNGYGKFYLADGSYTPQVGDCVLYRYSDDSTYDDIYHSDHIGIIVNVTGLHFSTIEGNTDGTNYRTTSVNKFDNRNVFDKNVHGFYVPNYNNVVKHNDGYIQLGDVNNYSYMLKTMLKLLKKQGYIKSNVDDKKGFGNGTLKAVREFQTLSKIEVDGIVGYETLKKMREVLLK